MRRIRFVALLVLALSACEGSSTPPYPLVASGDTWDLGFGYGVRGGAPHFALDTPRGSDLLYPGPAYPDLGSGGVYPLGDEGSLVYGTVPTEVTTVAVALEDGSVVGTNPFAPPETVTIERNLFALEVDQPPVTATLLDGGGHEVAAAELTWMEDVGSFFAFVAP